MQRRDWLKVVSVAGLAGGVGWAARTLAAAPKSATAPRSVINHIPAPTVSLPQAAKPVTTVGSFSRFTHIPAPTVSSASAAASGRSSKTLIGQSVPLPTAAAPAPKKPAAAAASSSSVSAAASAAGSALGAGPPLFAGACARALEQFDQALQVLGGCAGDRVDGTNARN